MQCTVQDVENFVARRGLLSILREVSEYILQAYKDDWNQFDKKERVAFYTKDGPIELMPICDDYFFSVKYVNCHNKNPSMNLLSVVGLGIMSSTITGYPIFVSEMTLLTAIRTAATSALVGKYLMPKHSKKMAIIGNGAQCEFQALAFYCICGIKDIYLFDIDNEAMNKAKKHLQTLMNVYECASIEDAVHDADVVTTCTNVDCHANLLSFDFLKENVHVNAVGGDRPGKTELDRRILDHAKIFVEFEPQTRIEGEIQIGHFNTVELHDLFNDENFKRDGITVYDSVGFALEDYCILKYMHDATVGENNSHFLPRPDNPKDLFSCIVKNGSDVHF